MSAGNERGGRVGWILLGVGSAGTLMAVIVWLWPAGGHSTERFAARPGVRVLSDGEMKATVGGFTTLKGKWTCGSCGCAEGALSGFQPTCLEGQEGGGTFAPQLDPGTGNLSDSVAGPSVSAVGGGLSDSFRYDSDLADGTNSPLNLSMGYGWTHGYETSLMESGQDMVWLKADGRISHYDGGPAGFRPMPGEFATLQRTAPGVFEVRMTNGTRYVYDRTAIGPWPGVRHLPSSVSDSNGRTTAYTYDAQDRLTQVTDPFGNRLTFEYDAGGRLTEVTDPLGRETRFEYDASGSTLQRITLADGTVIEYAYDAQRRMVRKTVRDPCTRAADVDRDGDVDLDDFAAFAGCVSGPDNPLASPTCGACDQQVDQDVDLVDFALLQAQIDGGTGSSGPPPPCPETEEYVITYDAGTGRPGTMHDLNGNPVFGASSSNGWQVDHAQSLLSGEMRYTPGTSTVIDGRGSPWRYSYDDRGRITQIEAPLVAGQPAIRTYEYDGATRLVREHTDALGRVTRYQYDGNGNMVEMTDALGNVTSSEYDHATIPALRTRTVEPDGDAWVWQYDANGNLLQETDPLIESPTDGVTTYTYDGVGRRESITDRNGHVTTYEYDAPSRMILETVDPGGLDLITENQYDGVGNRVQTTDSRGIVTEYEYDTRDRAIRETRDPGGLNLSTQYDYDGRSNRTEETNPRGFTTTYEYDARDRLIRTIDPLSHVTEYNYDGNNNRASTTDANGNVTLYQYDERNRLSRQIDDFGGSPNDLNITTRYQYDAADNRVRMIREMDDVPDDGPDRVTEYTYDALNRLTLQTVDPGGLNLTTQYDYAPPGGGGCGCNGTPGSSQKHQTTDAEGKVTYYYYDALDRQIKVVRKVNDTADNEGDADDAITVTTYDPVGNVIRTLTEADPSPDQVLEYHYDAADRRIQQTVDPTGANLFTTYAYDGNGNTVQTIAPNGNVTTTIYDNADRQISSSDSVGPLMTYDYDANANVIRTLDGNGNGNTTPHVYDADDRLTAQYDALGRPITYQYDSLNNRTSQTDRSGHITRYEYDGIYRRTAEVRADGEIDIRSEFRYDDAGNLRDLKAHNQTHTGPEVQITEYQYDAANRRIREIYPDDEDSRPRDKLFTYDGVGNITLRIDQNQDRTHYDYDDLRRLTLRSYTLDAGSLTYPPVQLPDTYTYDRASQMLSAVHQYSPPDPDVTVTFMYDGVGRVATLTQDTRTIQYAYQIDPLINRRETTYPSGRILRKESDKRDRLDVVTDQPSGALIADRGYDPGDRLITQLYGNTTNTLWQYNPNDWTTRITHANGGGPFIDLQYGHDNEGNPLFAKHHHALDTSELYAYDAADRLTDFQRGTLNPTNDAMTTYTPHAEETQRQQWTLDKLGNWRVNQIRRDNVESCEERFANKVDEYTSLEPGQPCPPAGGVPVPLIYDDNGNLDNDPTAGPGAVGLRYEHDIENRLTRVARLSDNAIVARYFYDALGRRVRKAVTNSGALNGTTGYLLNERWQALAEYDASGLLLREYTYATFIDEPLTLDRNLDADGSAIGPGDERLFFHRNVLFSVSGLTDSSGGLEETYRYDAYGEPIIADGGGSPIVQSAFDNNLRFTGRQLDPETRSYHYRARYLNSNLGRFLTRDPLGPWFDHHNHGNAYAYVDSNPAIRFDPMGLEGCPIGMAGTVKNTSAFGPDLWNCTKAKLKKTYTHESEVEASIEIEKGPVKVGVKTGHKEGETEEVELECCQCVKFQYNFRCTCRGGFWRGFGHGFTLGLGALVWDGGYWDCTKTGEGLVNCNVKVHCPKECK